MNNPVQDVQPRRPAPGEVVLQLPSAGTAKVLRTLDDFARYL
ncbi:hypothetical protein OH779_18805 [Actinacidiphila glaucinigra]